MKRYYYMSENIEEIEATEHELEETGIARERIHVLSNNEEEIVSRKLHGVNSVFRKNMLQSGIFGAGVGILGAVLVLGAVSISDLPQTYTWAPFIFLSIVVLGFCTWEGGFLGIQEPHHEFKHFDDDLRHGKHVLLVDITDDQSDIVNGVLAGHPSMQPTGTGSGPVLPVIKAQEWVRRWLTWGP